MNLSIDVEDEAWSALPDLEHLSRAAVAAGLTGAGAKAEGIEVALLFTDDKAIAEINAEWRGKDAPTNVLSFPAPADIPIPAGETRPLGDVVLAYGVVAREAADQGKTLRDHTTHLILHGVLHLLGYDHEDDEEAEEMERLEAGILKGLGISNPYERQ
ncbi:rRNA maturation RNase YbeY [Aestuariivirga sp.]|uniref:rRNA maturation RNase YbeY n=1 Tax=Aestuariivirga sp. TaxID=2650926 RepID=UPI003593BF67